MGDFAFRITPNIILGSYTLSRLPQQVMEWGTRFMIIADPVLNEFGTIQKITQSFTDRKIEHFVFSEISEGNTSQLAKRALALAKEASKTQPVSWEFTPHHLLLDNSSYNVYETFIKTNPPLREKDKKGRIKWEYLAKYLKVTVKKK